MQQLQPLPQTEPCGCLDDPGVVAWISRDKRRLCLHLWVGLVTALVMAITAATVRPGVQNAVARQTQILQAGTMPGPIPGPTKP